MNPAFYLTSVPFFCQESETGAQGDGESSRCPPPPEAASRRHALSRQVCRLHETNPPPGAGEVAPRSQTLTQRHRSDARTHLYSPLRRSEVEGWTIEQLRFRQTCCLFFPRCALGKGLGETVRNHRMCRPSAPATVLYPAQHQHLSHHHQRLQQPVRGHFFESF